MRRRCNISDMTEQQNWCFASGLFSRICQIWPIRASQTQRERVSSLAAAGRSVSTSLTVFFHHKLREGSRTTLCTQCTSGQNRLSCPLWPPPAPAVSRLASRRRRIGPALELPSRGSNIGPICCYLGNVLHSLHGHICSRTLTSLLFLAPAAAALLEVVIIMMSDGLWK